LDEWAIGRTQFLPLSALKGAVIGIDASHYINHHLHHHTTREPLLIALGGFPFALKSNIERELQTFKNLGIGCVFVFNGLDFGKREPRPHVRAESIRAFEQAWELYDQQQADQVVDAFSSAGTLSSAPAESNGALTGGDIQELRSLNSCTGFCRGFSTRTALSSWSLPTAPQLR